MTEAGWLAATDPAPMLLALRSQPSDRKLRLFAVACCRRLAPCSEVGEGVSALDVAEQFAEGLVSDAARSDARKMAQRAAQGKGASPTPTAPKWERRAASAVYYAAARDAGEAAWNARLLVEESLVWKAGGYGGCDAGAIASGENRPQAVILRCIFGNPFRPAAFDPAWLSETAVALATGIYAERAFDRLPILADALEEAGCDDEHVLSHCRGDGPHVLGCWVVDAVLGKGCGRPTDHRWTWEERVELIDRSGSWVMRIVLRLLIARNWTAAGFSVGEAI